MIAILCTQSNSVYESLQSGFTDRHGRPIELHLYDRHRNAFTFDQSNQVIAHPPCRHWAKLKGMANQAGKELEMELGRFCARKVIQNGGILEHPFDSKLFPDMGLPLGGCENDLGFTLEIPQRWFGHAMIKNTWLFCSKMSLSDFDPIPLRLTGEPVKSIANLSHRQREATPIHLAIWLIRAVANSSR